MTRAGCMNLAIVGKLLSCGNSGWWVDFLQKVEGYTNGRKEILNNMRGSSRLFWTWRQLSQRGEFSIIFQELIPNKIAKPKF